MSVLIKQNDASGNNADLLIAGRSIMTQNLNKQKLFTTVEDLDTDKTERKISLNYGIPTYKGSVPEDKFSKTGLSLSQGNDETSGIHLNGDRIVMWSPCDGATDSIVLYDEDDGRDVFKVQSDGKVWSKTTTAFSDNENILSTKRYADMVAVPDTAKMISQTWASGSTYTAPNNGWVYLYRSGAMSGGTNSQTNFYVRVGTNPYRYQFAFGNSQVNHATIMCPVAKGDSLYFYFSNSSYAPNHKYFIPAKSVNEK